VQELAFVNVEFASGQFWALVAVDFVMLVVRDVRMHAQHFVRLRTAFFEDTLVCSQHWALHAHT
jgi:hypothetical protein